MLFAENSPLLWTMRTEIADILSLADGIFFLIVYFLHSYTVYFIIRPINSLLRYTEITRCGQMDIYILYEWQDAGAMIKYTKMPLTTTRPQDISCIAGAYSLLCPFSSYFGKHQPPVTHANPLGYTTTTFFVALHHAPIHKVT